MNIDHLLCFKCMRRLNSPGETCSHCGHDNSVRQNGPGMLSETLLGGQYQVGAVLGRGGFGITYIGYDLNLRRPVAIKEFYPSHLVFRDSDKCTISALTGSEKDFIKGCERALNESRMVAGLGQIYGVVQVYNVLSANGTVYIVMEYVEGQSFTQYIDAQEKLMTPAEVTKLLAPIAGALTTLHARKVVHRDVKPDNIMIRKENHEGVLLDFGAARVADDSTMSNSAAVVSQGYAPPEQYTLTTLDGKVDQYAFAATIYHALSGKRPPDVMARMAKGGALPSLCEVNPVVNALVNEVIAKGMSIDADQRFGSVEEFWESFVSLACEKKKTVLSDNDYRINKFLCFKCMKELHYPRELCPHCGYDNAVRKNPFPKLGEVMLEDRYQIGALLGESDFGFTYIAYDHQMDFPVIIKEVFPACPESISRDKDNYTVISTDPFSFNRHCLNIEHDVVARPCPTGFARNINRFYANNTFYIVMEYIEGQTLQQYLDNNHRVFTPKEAFDLLSPVAHTLISMTYKDVYWNLKPSNIMLCANNSHSILLDYAAPRDLDVYSDDFKFKPLDKYPYFPIEFISLNVYENSNVFSLATIFYRLIIGKFPPDARDRLFKDKFLTRSENVDRRINDLLSYALELSTKSRIQSVEEFWTKLGYLLSITLKSETTKVIENKNTSPEITVIKNMDKISFPDDQKERKSFFSFFNRVFHRESH